MSATWKELRIVASMASGHRARARCGRALRAADSSGCAVARRRLHGAPPLALDRLAGAARSLDALARAGTESVGVDGESLGELALREHLHRYALARGESAFAHQLERNVGARVEALLQRGDVDGLRVRAKRLEGHRLLHV